MRDILLITFWGNFPFVIKESQVLIGPNFSRNTGIQYLLGIFNDTGGMRDERVVSWKFHD